MESLKDYKYSKIHCVERMLLFVLFMFTLSCSTNIDKSEKKSDSLKEAIIDTIKNQPNSFQISINEKNYELFVLNNQFYGLMERGPQGDTVVPFEKYYANLEILDIDLDGINDLRAYIFANSGNECYNYLFDKKEQKFRLVENCFLNIKKIEGSEFYHSYHRMGCADRNWVSELGKIENDQLVPYGIMYGFGCEDDNRIKIYKCINGREDSTLLISTLPYLENIPEFGDKWEFMETYWKKNYKKFE
jgi:hypothetical protein